MCCWPVSPRSRMPPCHCAPPISCPHIGTLYCTHTVHGILRSARAAGVLIPTAAATTSSSTGRTGRQTAQGRVHGAREHTAYLRYTGSSGGKFRPFACQLDCQHQLSRARPPDTTSEESAVHTAHERVLQGSDVV